MALALAVSLPLALVGALLLRFAPAAVALGAGCIVVMPAIAGALVATRAHGVDAILLTMLVSLVSLLVAAAVVFGVGESSGLGLLLFPMLVTSVFGVLIGIVGRPWLRRWLGP
jgi:hypothetical protein